MLVVADHRANLSPIPEGSQAAESSGKGAAVSDKLMIQHNYVRHNLIREVLQKLAEA